MMKPYQQLIVGIFLALFSASIGFNLSQLTVVKQVSINTEVIQYLKEADTREAQQRVAYQESFDKRLLRIVEQVERVIEQNNLLITKLSVKGS